MARKWWTLIAVCTGVFMLLLDITIVNVALPDSALVFGLIRSANGWASPEVGGSLVTAGVLLAVFVVIEATSAHPMLDLGLLRVPTFTGGLIAAWGISASAFAMLTFLVLYLQNVLGFSALETGLRLLPLSAAVFVTAAIAGRLTSLVPIRWLIAPGFVMVGVGLLLMRGIAADQSWTHLLPGFIVTGVGAGLINVPLASTAVGVVSPERAGMASGINSTLRQVGIATGVAALGSILATQLRSSILDQLQSGPLSAGADHLAAAISSGRVRAALASVPPELRATAAHAAGVAFAVALNHILLITAVVAGCAAAASAILIRPRDFVTAEHPVTRTTTLAS